VERLFLQFSTLQPSRRSCIQVLSDSERSILKSGLEFVSAPIHPTLLKISHVFRKGS
jgi:hypothetical protein